MIAGCMFAGKTSALIERLDAARRAGRRVVACKHQLDARYDAIHLATHDGRTFPAIAVPDVEALRRAAADADVVGVDEAQFFGPPIVAVVDELIDRGVEVIAVGIDFNVRGKPFKPFPELKARAAEVVALTSPCTKCGKPARYSQRVTPIVNGDMVGGLKDYVPRCDDCFEPWSGPLPWD